jgi:hypothetical protein
MAKNWLICLGDEEQADKPAPPDQPKSGESVFQGGSERSSCYYALTIENMGSALLRNLDFPFSWMAT